MNTLVPLENRSLFWNRSPPLLAFPAYSIRQSIILTCYSARPCFLNNSLILKTFSSFSYLRENISETLSFSILLISALLIYSSTYLKCPALFSLPDTKSYSTSDRSYNFLPSTTFLNSSRIWKCLVVFLSPYLNSGKFSIILYISSIEVN